MVHKIEGYRYIGSEISTHGESIGQTASRIHGKPIALDQIGCGSESDKDFITMGHIGVDDEGHPELPTIHLWINRNFERRVKARLKKMGVDPNKVHAPHDTAADAPARVGDGPTGTSPVGNESLCSGKTVKRGPGMKGIFYHRSPMAKDSDYGVGSLGAYWSDSNNDLMKNAALDDRKLAHTAVRWTSRRK